MSSEMVRSTLEVGAMEDNTALVESLFRVTNQEEESGMMV